jgi:hypothetical protein
MSAPQTTSVSAPATTRVLARLDGGALGAWILGAALVVYLGVKGGGYDIVVRSEVGVVVWWVTLLGALVGALRAPASRAPWIAFGLLALLGVWTAIGATWSESAERTVVESGRLAMYLGAFALAAGVISRERVRPLVNGLATGITTVAVLAVLSRLHPAWFPGDAAATGEFLPSTRSRLAYPINYWNGLAALVALGLPLVLVSAAGARTLAARCAATAALPVLGLCWYLTLSRGGALAMGIAALAFVSLTSARGRALVAVALGAGGSTILAAAVEQRPELADGLQTALARHQGDELLTMVLVVCVGVGLIRLAAGLAEDHGLVPRLRWARPRKVGVMVAVGLAAVVAVAIAAGVPGAVGDQWDSFKHPTLGTSTDGGGTSARFLSTSGNGRYQYWQSAADAFKDQPLGGIGAGAFEFWWARNATLPGFVVNAHSLYFETIAEVGAIGLALLLGLFGTILVVGISRLRRTVGDQRALQAAALAGCVAFCVSAGVDWVWQIAVLPVCFLLLGAAALSTPADDVPRRPAGVVPRVGFAAVALVALAGLVVPLSGAVAVRDSQGAAQRRDVPAALAAATSAQRVQPYAVTPALQRALVLELAGDLPAAAVAAREAERLEPTNWRAPLVLARIEAQRGRVDASVAAVRRARALNQASPTLR